MTLLIWLAVSSLAWGAVLWTAGRILQRAGNATGAMRQWIWRGATALLIAPWVAAPLILLFGLGLAPAETVAVMTAAPIGDGDALGAMHALDAGAVETAVVENGGSLMAWLAANPVQAVLLVVIAGWLVRFVMAQHALKSLLGIVNMSHPAGSGPAKGFVGSWTRRLKLRREPRLLVTQEQHSPFSFGMMHPTICLPEGLEEKLSKESLDLVVGHECLHVARGDGWLRPVERVTADILWFNPFAWLMRRELDVARELAVDEAMIALVASRKIYARALRDVASFSAGLSPTAPAASMSLAGGRSLMLRVTRTLSEARRKPARAAMVAACMLGLLGAPIAVAQVMLAVPAPPAPPASIDPPEPPAPPEPPKVEENVYVSADGMVRASFPAKITAAGPGRKGGYAVSLESTGQNGKGEGCQADLDGLGPLEVVRGDVVARGEALGRRGSNGSLSFSVRCTDQTDAAGRLEFPDPEAAPPAPPAPPSAREAVAPLAPVAPPSPVAAPHPAPAPAPVPPTPRVGQVPTVAPTPPAPPTWNGRQPPAAPTAPPTPAATKSPILLDGARNAVISAPARISGQYGARVDPINQQPAFHDGVDVAAAAGTRVQSPVEGVIVYAGHLDAYGNTVKLQARDGVTMTFAQMDEINVKTGDKLVAGALIGTVGSSGRSTGPHLHLEVAQNGQTQDPEKVTGLVLIDQN